MLYMIPGILGFAACCLFDLNKIRWNIKFLNLFFVLGSLLLILATIGGILSGNSSGAFTDLCRLHPAALAGLLLSIIAEIYALFFALPFESTYLESEAIPVVSRGWYAACRHPGFWTLALVYFFLWQFFSTPEMLLAFVVYTLCNFLYIYIQDRFIFPEYIQGYAEYQKRVPFLIPTKKSLRQAFTKK